MDISSQPSGVLGALSRCQKSGEFTDLTFICEGESFNVHKVVVFSQSDVLHAACTGNFKEASSALFDLNEDSKIIVGKLVSFFYTENYSNTIQASRTEQPVSCSALHLHVRVFILPDKYIIKGLLALCVEKYQKRPQFLSDPIEFIESIPEVYALPPTAPRPLKEVVARFARINISNYLQENTVNMA
ncbi:BTB/POZ fold [Penicillium digitatum]|uniref:BTB/POZ fold n=1 Tax=Penicillium digitatum TaxID=36651 RepID=A0A7T7BJL0_PENDI|nr:BTB/POZ fold [Penicillium digitatum]